MPDQHEVSPPQPWLVRTSGEFAGTRHVLRETTTRVGRGSDNDIVIDEPIVSSYHFEIQNERGAYKICDLKSTNGTFVNGSRIGEANLTPSASIQVGVAGPEFLFVIEEAPAAARSKMKIDGQATLVSEAPDVLSSLRRNTGTATARAHDELLSTAIARARIARERGFGNQTTSIMRQMLSDALRRTHRNLKALITILVFLLLASTGYGLWKIQSLRAEKLNIDTQIANLEALLKKSELTAEQADQLADRLEKYEREGRTLQTSLLYRVSVRQPDDLIEGDIATLMAEFGAETYTVPREFVEQVKRFIQRYQGPDRPHMTAALGRSQKDVATMRRILEQAHLPADLVFVALVESAISNANTSSAGAAGIWQFTPATARAYGLSVSNKVDERLDIRKSTEAASKLLRDLILDFGSGSSVMLALAAYNAGTAKVKQGIRRVNDPIKQRNFWYLYRIRALPLETREYVPKVIAAMIVARDPLKFGF